MIVSISFLTALALSRSQCILQFDLVAGVRSFSSVPADVSGGCRWGNSNAPLFWIQIRMYFFYPPSRRSFRDCHTPGLSLANSALFFAVCIPALGWPRGARKDARCRDCDHGSQESEAKERGDELALLGKAQRSVHRRVIRLMAGRRPCQLRR